ITDKEEDISLKVLDTRQENHARNIGDGHRIVYGVAGSGKTVILIARARLISQQQPEKKLLFLCFNVSLAAYLRQTLRDCPNITVLHFDGWSKANGITRRMNEENPSLGHRLLIALESGHAPHAGYFDAIMVDEAQDFDISWFKCIREAMKDPDDGDLIIVGDGSQGLYKNRGISWKQIGIHARGRTITGENLKKFDLDKNYRNSKEIIELAAI
ncbi:hypothetical protein TI03_07280, partial [Achromatium sp. WMS1]